MKIRIFDKKPDISQLEFISLSNHLWAETYPCFFESKASVSIIKNSGLYVVMMSDEPSPKVVYTKRDEPIYKDSCLEFFCRPFEDDARYFNFEINPNGAYLSEAGTQRKDRSFIKDITGIEAEVTVLTVENGWGIGLFIPERLISEVFGREFSLAELGYISANFYKCGEETDSPHFSSAFFVGTPTPDFHRPEYFEKLYIRTA